MTNALNFWQAAFIAVAAAGISYGLIVLLMPLLRRYAQARPNARSSHKIPTPQGGGAAVIASVIFVVTTAMALLPATNFDVFHFTAIFAAVAGLAVLGATDDIRPLEALPRLLLQAAAVTVIVSALPEELRIIQALPLWLERVLILVTIIWLVNLVNFMDGIDWMTVAEVAPVTAGLAVFGLMGELPNDAMLVAIALCGAILGFAPLNRPVARLFLGDVGSLPIGLLLGWLLILLAGRGHLVAALLLPLYYLADATITLLRRIINSEPIFQAHRDHFYQRAKDGGSGVIQIVGLVFATNIVLVGLAAVTLIYSSFATQVVTLILGSALVGTLLFIFGRTSR